jgi:hypothetical protein
MRPFKVILKQRAALQALKTVEEREAAMSTAASMVI